MTLPIFLTKNSVDIEVERIYPVDSPRNDIGELVNTDSDSWADRGVIEVLMEPGYTGRNQQSNQGKDARQRFRLFLGLEAQGLPPDGYGGIKMGDFVTSGEDRYEVGVVFPYESHIEAIMFKI